VGKFGAVSTESAREEIAPAPFLAARPNRLLIYEGSAFATYGHIHRAGAYSFAWPDVRPQMAHSESTLRQLLSGHPLGSALEYLNQRHAGFASDFSPPLEEVAGGMDPDDVALAGMSTARNDARVLTIVGAVRLAAVSPEAVPR
jgi:hypothetical protein